MSLTRLILIFNLVSHCCFGLGRNEYPIDLSQIKPENYNRLTPQNHEDNATEVLFHLTVNSIDSIDEKAMTYSANVFLAQSWKDNRLKFPNKMTKSHQLLPVEWLKQIWKPDPFIKEAKSVVMHEVPVPNHYIWLWKDNTILYMSKLDLVLSCDMQFEKYPHDTQTCSIQMESLSHTTDELFFSWDPHIPYDINKAIQLPEMELISSRSEDCTRTYSTGKYSCVGVSLVLRRKSGIHFFTTYIPAAVTVAISWISFWIKPRFLTCRVILGLFCLLSLRLQSAEIRNDLPRISSLKAVDVFMATCSIFVLLSLAELALMAAFTEAEIGATMNGYVESKVDSAEEDCKGIYLKTKQNAVRIDKLARAIFPGFFFAFLTGYFIYFMH